jgi:hypothetical protein
MTAPSEYDDTSAAVNVSAGEVADVRSRLQRLEDRLGLTALQLGTMAAGLFVLTGLVLLLVFVPTASILRVLYHLVVVAAGIALICGGVLMVGQWLQNRPGEQVTPRWLLVGGVSLIILGALLLHLHAYTLAAIPERAVDSVYGRDPTAGH